MLLSAQCTDEQVNRVTPELFRAAPTPGALARLSFARVHGLIRSCGLAPTKAARLRALAAVLEREHGGRVPESLEALEALPGVGHKTASVVVAQAFGRPAFPVDTHIHRLAARGGLSSGKNVAVTERDLKRLFPEKSWSRVHLQMITFGREHCPARGHDPKRCPVCSWAGVRRLLRARESRGG